MPVLIIWRLPLFIRKQTFILLSFFLINWLLNDCSSWNVNAFVLVVELIWFIPFQSVIISSYFVFFLLMVLFNTRKLKIIKVKTSCNLYYRVKEKKESYMKLKILQEIWIRYSSRRCRCHVLSANHFHVLTPNIGWLVPVALSTKFHFILFPKLRANY